MANWLGLKQSEYVGTSSADYICLLRIDRDVSGDVGGVVPSSSNYLFQLYLQRRSAYNRSSNSWSVRDILDSSYDTGIFHIWWPASNPDDMNTGYTQPMSAGTNYLLHSFTRELPNNGATHCVQMLASCNSGQPKDCNAILYFTTPVHAITPGTPTGLRVSNSPPNNPTISWNSAHNAVRYDIAIDVYGLNSLELARTDYTYSTDTVETLDFSTYNPGDRLKVFVRSVSSTGHPSDWSAPVTIDFGGTAKVRGGGRWQDGRPKLTAGSGNPRRILGCYIRVDGRWVLTKTR